jgi:Uma2 family endonuclease
VRSLPLAELEAEQGAVVYPESDGPPVGETDLHIGALFDLRFMLRDWLRDVPDTYVGTGLFIYYVEGDPSQVFCPDVFVAFGVDGAPRRTYKLWEEGRAPTVVIEVTSRRTWLEDEGNKKVLCERLGVGEYFLYDPEGAYLEPPLQGYELVDGAYVRLEPDESGRLRSAALGLTLEREAGRLALRSATTGQPVLPPEAEVERLRAELRRLRGG